ncbi:MAG TPA: hypothetical protein VK009_26755 [Chloroflexota bacterium]|nr:hypothetical protein [Chloroflexota bacterium]
MLIAAAVLLVPAAAFIGVFRQWRRCLLSLGALFLLVGIVLMVVNPTIAVCQMISGATALAVMFLCGRQIFSETHQALVVHNRLPAWEYLFESIVAAVAAVGAALFARAHPLFGLPGPVTFSWVWLGLAGLFMVVLAGNILEVGLGLVVFATGLNLLIVATSLATWWPALLAVQLVPIAVALLTSVAGIRLSHFGHGVGLDLLLDKAPFVMASARPVRIQVRSRVTTPESLSPPAGA